MGNANQLDILQTMLNQIKIDDPNIRALVKRHFKDSRRITEQTETANEIIRRLRIQNKKLMEQVGLLKEKQKQNRAERNQLMNRLNHLKKLNHSLSDAVGSCNVCWGEDPGCSNCSGNGMPGWRNINKRLFNIYVFPCLEKLYGFNPK